MIAGRGVSDRCGYTLRHVADGLAADLGRGTFMWGRRKKQDADRPAPDGARRLREALHEARIEAAERTGVVVDLRDAEIARLELVNEELDPVFAGIAAHIDLFDRGISRGDTPRLWIDAIAHIEMGRDKRTYRFVQDSRFGREVLAESLAGNDIVQAVTKYVARRMIERERALAGAEPLPRRRPRWRGAIVVFLLGVVVGMAVLLFAAWFSASFSLRP
jgi:hypothetical protein